MVSSFEGSGFFEELETAFEAAEKAGRIIDEFVEEGFETSEKSDGSKVTEADLRSQEKIVEVISGEFPEDGFLGEEEDLSPEGEDLIWVIDPIDGTFNFDKGFSHLCVSIALEVGGEPVVGVVYSPEGSVEDSYFAVKGFGAYRTSGRLEEGERISVSGKKSLDGAMFFLSLFDIYEGELEAEMNVLESLATEGAVHRQLGSGALELARLAAGEVDFYVNPIAKHVDFAAARLIVEEAGGSFRLRESRFPEDREIIASNGLLQDEVEDIVGDVFQ